MDEGGFAVQGLIEESYRSSMDELSQWTAWTNKVFVF
jgi:hypothetical protein